MDGAQKRRVEPYGNALVAIRSFAPGEVVIRDRPLLATSECSTLLDKVYDAHKELGIRADLLGKDASIDFTLQLLQYRAASNNIKAAVRKLFTPDAEAFRDEPYVRAARQYADQLGAAQMASPDAVSRSVLGPIASGWDPGELIGVVLTWVCNCYSARDGGGALYEHGSLVNHCCEGNTRYRFLEDEQGGGGCGVFVAVRPIQPGEVITTCYLGWDEQTLISTRMRRKLLVKTKLFTCTCSRCCHPRDPYRSLPCPRCNTASAGGDGGGGQVAVIAAVRSGGLLASLSPSSPGSSGVAGVTTTTTTSNATDATNAWAFSGRGDEGGDESRGSGGAGGGGGDSGCGGKDYFCRAHCGANAAAGHSGGGGGFVYWSVADSGGDGGGDETTGGQGRPWECDTCGGRFLEEEARRELRRRAAAAGWGAEDDDDDDPELALEEEVHDVGERLDWTDLAVSLGAVRQLGARCQAVLGQRHWATNRCRYTVLGMCTAALTQACAKSRTAGSDGSGTGGGDGDGDGYGRGAGGGGDGHFDSSWGGASVRSAGGAAVWRTGSSGGAAGLWGAAAAAGGRRTAPERSGGGGVPTAGGWRESSGGGEGGGGRGCVGAAGSGSSGVQEAAAGAAGAFTASQLLPAPPAGAATAVVLDTPTAVVVAPGPAVIETGLITVSAPAMVVTAAATTVAPPGLPAAAGAIAAPASEAAAAADAVDAAAASNLDPTQDLTQDPAQDPAQDLTQDSAQDPAQDPAQNSAQDPAQGVKVYAALPPPLGESADPASAAAAPAADGAAATAASASAVAAAAWRVPAPPAPHVNPHLGSATLHHHTLHHHTLHQQARWRRQQHRMQRQLQQQQMQPPLQRQPQSHPTHAQQQDQKGCCGEPPPLGRPSTSASGADALTTAGTTTAGAGAVVEEGSRMARSWRPPGGQQGGRGDVPAAGDGCEPGHGGHPHGEPRSSSLHHNDVTGLVAAAPPPSTAPPTAATEAAPLAAEATVATQAVGAAAVAAVSVSVSEAARCGSVVAAHSGGGSTLWSLVEADALVTCMCEELQALWQWQQQHTPHEPAVVLKAVAGPAATALMDVVKEELCSSGAVSARALATAEATAAQLVASYESAPYYDVSGEAYAEAVTVVQLCPLIRLALDIEDY